MHNAFPERGLIPLEALFFSTLSGNTYSSPAAIEMHSDLLRYVDSIESLSFVRSPWTEVVY